MAFSKADFTICIVISKLVLQIFDFINTCTKATKLHAGALHFQCGDRRTLVLFMGGRLGRLGQWGKGNFPQQTPGHLAL